ncbi:AbrB family transcriptional regulator [Alicyclobacillus tolerans]|uniref:AbrB/MazE/SpoVT family DNA-binding domain-containing protein n=1 Tax=Alicyclobacillus tolerans TaxID=90970 RepID=UPI001F441D46|nr:AbrB/MazE/SpoVT family DNA-binding domain-containing protein [Alicyclobacillus tolerans]MCF8568619.1 AbrB family transcriptional regulator [Alicyclobacillus tolerans]
MEPVHRKVTKIGNSLGVTLNKELLNKINADLGDDLEIIVNQNEGEIVLRKAPKVPQGLDSRFFELLQANVEQYRKTIEGLKDR